MGHRTQLSDTKGILPKRSLPEPPKPVGWDTRVQVQPEAESSCTCRWLSSQLALGTLYLPRLSQHPSPPCPLNYSFYTGFYPAIPMLRRCTSSHCPQEESKPSGLTVKVPHELAAGSSPAYPIVSHFPPAQWSGAFHRRQASPCSCQACLEDHPSPDSPHTTS